MRILFLVDSLQDYVSDPLYFGLVRLLGQDCIVDYPSKAIFHDPSAKLWFLPQIPAVDHSEVKVRTLLNDRFFDMVCMASPRPEILGTLSRLYTSKRFPPIVFIDGADDAEIRQDVADRYPLAVYFKREYTWQMGSRLSDLWASTWTFGGNRQLFNRTFPLPMSIVMDALPDLGPVSKEIDISYRGRASHQRRVKAVKILSQIEGVRFSGGVYASPDDRKYKLKVGAFKRLWTKVFEDSPASQADQEKKQAPEAYYREIAASRIAVSIRGGGWMTPRYFEIVAMGTMLLADRPDALIPNDFVDRRHAVYFKPDLSDLEPLVRHYLREEAERERITAEGRAHLLKYHTCERRAEYFLNICQRLV